MSRTVAALYDSRAEAEHARARLISGVGARSPRIIARDTLGAVDGLKIAPRDAQSYREGLRRGAHLLVAEVPRGTSPKRVVELLEASIGQTADEAAVPASPDVEEGVSVEIADEPRGEQAAETPSATAPERPIEQAPVAAPPLPAAPAMAEEDSSAATGEELRIGRRAFTRETPAEEQVTLRHENVEVESRPSERQLTDGEVEAGGLFTNRVIEIAEMREEPVVTKVAVVREEVIVRKRVTERTETIRDTVRHMEVEVEDAAASEGTSPDLIGKGPRGRRGR